MRPGPVEVVAGADSAPEPDSVERMLEALLFASAEPLSLKEMRQAVPEGSDLRGALGALRERYAGRGVELRRSGDRWAFRTAADLEWLFVRSRLQERRLSRAALETLAIIAYHQPVSRAEIEEIRGVAVSPGTVGTLMELGWVGLGRRRRAPGRPVTYVVTAQFLDHFGLENTGDLPGNSELKALGLLDPPAAAAAAALAQQAAAAEAEPAQEDQTGPA